MLATDLGTQTQELFTAMEFVHYGRELSCQDSPMYVQTSKTLWEGVVQSPAWLITTMQCLMQQQALGYR